MKKTKVKEKNIIVSKHINFCQPSQMWKERNHTKSQYRFSVDKHKCGIFNQFFGMMSVYLSTVDIIGLEQNLLNKLHKTLNLSFRHKYLDPFNYWHKSTGSHR